MKRFPNVGTFAASTVIGLVLSYFITIVAWNLAEHRMFHCTDDVGFAYIVENIDDHRLAGDALCAGWTWEAVKAAKLFYLVTFFGLWFAVAAMPRWISQRKDSNESVV
jgi:hypothetical protein